jgi:lipid-A-disaccharide synthase
MHGALLLDALRKLEPDLRCTGMGGPHLRAAGLEALFRTEDLSVMGITEVAGQLPRILRMLSGIAKTLEREKPDALVVIDSPDFHFRVIKAARRCNIPVYYYISPKIWAWRRNRARFIRDNVRRMLSILPFEKEFYRHFGMDVDYVGNPLMDLLHRLDLQGVAREPGLIGLLPGSRKKEVTALLREFAGAARILRRRLPGVSFACLRAPGIDADLLRNLWPEDLPVSFIEPDLRWGFMRRCEMLVAASGTAALESAVLGVPTIVVYKVSSLSYALGRLLVRVPFISLPNLILERAIFPELLQKQCDAAPLADAALLWLLPRRGERPLEKVRRELEEIRRLLGGPGAADRAAAIILRDLDQI